jgi:signal peptidase I
MFWKNLHQHKNSDTNLKLSLTKKTDPAVLHLFEDILNSDSNLRVKVTGRSMSPFLHGEEILTIKKVPYTSLRRGDLILFKNHLGYPVLHRIIKKKQDQDDVVTFQTKGDAMIVFDEPVRNNKILGKVCKIEDGSKYINMETKMWSRINYMAAVISLLESRLYFALKAFKNLF